jgi:hypothetical protein
MIDFESATEKIFEKLNLGIEGKDMIEDIPAPEPQPGQPQPIDPSQPVDENSPMMGEQLPPEYMNAIQDLQQPLPEGAQNPNEQ